MNTQRTKTMDTQIGHSVSRSLVADRAYPHSFGGPRVRPTIRARVGWFWTSSHPDGGHPHPISVSTPPSTATAHHRRFPLEDAFSWRRRCAVRYPRRGRVAHPHSCWLLRSASRSLVLRAFCMVPADYTLGLVTANSPNPYERRQRIS